MYCTGCSDNKSLARWKSAVVIVAPEMGDAEGQLPVVLLGANSSENLIISARGCLWNGDEYAQKSGIPTAAACSADGKAAAVAADPKRLLVLKVEGGEAQSRPIFRAVLEV